MEQNNLPAYSYEINIWIQYKYCIRQGWDKVVHWKDWCWSWNSNTLATSCKELTHWKRLWCWEGLGAGGEGDNRGWDGWMASPTRWTWAWENSGSWWWTGRPGMLRFMGLQRVGHNWATELNWTEYSIVYMYQNFLIHSSGRWILNHWTTREVPEMRFKMSLWFNFLTSLVIVSEIDWD